MEIKRLFMFLILFTILSCNSQEKNIVRFETKVNYKRGDSETKNAFYYTSSNPRLFMMTTTYPNDVERDDKIFINNKGYHLELKPISLEHNEYTVLVSDYAIDYEYNIEPQKVNFNNLECTKVILKSTKNKLIFEVLVSENNVINNVDIIKINFNMRDRPIDLKGLVVKIDQVAYYGREKEIVNEMTYLSTESSSRQIKIDLSKF